MRRLADCRQIFGQRHSTGFVMAASAGQRVGKLKCLD